jgi:hypothetical protein
MWRVWQRALGLVSGLVRVSRGLMEVLDSRDRSHGSRHEAAMPLVMFNQTGDATFQANVDFTHGLFCG